MHSLIPELDHAIVQRGENPRPDWVEAQTLDTVALGLEFGQHLSICLARCRLNDGSVHLEIAGLIGREAAAKTPSVGIIA